MRLLKLITVVAGASICLGSGLLAAQDASATSCGGTHWCYYLNSNYGGASFGDSGGIDNFATYTYNGTSVSLDNSVSSVKSPSGFEGLALYSGAHRTGTLMYIGNANDASLGSFDNQASSSAVIAE